MLGRILRFLLRLLGWLFTPLVVTAAGASGATLGFLIAGSWESPRTIALFALGCGFAGALAGCLLWLRILRRSPRLREALAVTKSGLPEPDAVHEMLQSVALEDKSPT